MALALCRIYDLISVQFNQNKIVIKNWRYFLHPLWPDVSVLKNQNMFYLVAGDNEFNSLKKNTQYHYIELIPVCASEKLFAFHEFCNVMYQLEMPPAW